MDISDLGVTTNNTTFPAWIKPSTINQDDGIVFQSRTAGDADGLYIAEGNSNLGYHWGTSYNDVNLNIPLDTWSFVAMTVSPSEFVLYHRVAGGSMETVSVAGSFSPQSFSDFEIARDSRLSHSFSGLIDDVRMYDRTLSASEITQRYQMGAPVGSSTALPQGCPDIGDVCDDGTIYVRLSPDGNTPMFAVQESITGIRWAAAYGGSPIGNTQCGGTSYPGADIGCNTGMENTQYLVSEGIGPDPAPFSAARYCHSLLSNYTDDWYLPAHNELYVVYDNLLSNFGFSSLSQEFNFPISGGQSIHWSSSDRYDSDANIVDFDDGRFQYGAGETNSNHSIRCVRKGPAPRCANPYGLEGEMVYNSDHDVVQFCDGARWIAIGKAAPPTPPG